MEENKISKLIEHKGVLLGHIYYLMDLSTSIKKNDLNEELENQVNYTINNNLILLHLLDIEITKLRGEDEE